MPLPTKIPKKFYPYFWDTDPRRINPSEKPLFVIQRLLDWNEPLAWRWVLKSFPKNSIKESLTTLRGWSGRSANFWGVYLNIPKGDILWNRPGFPNPPQRHWKF